MLDGSKWNVVTENHTARQGEMEYTPGERDLARASVQCTVHLKLDVGKHIVF